MPNILRVRTVWTGWAGGPGLTQLYFKPTQATPQLDAATVVARVRAALLAIAPLLAATTQLQVSGSVDVIDDATGVLTGGVAVASPPVVTGTGAGPNGAPQVMAGAVLDTGVVVDRRKLRGRVFVGPLQNGSSSSLLPAPAVLAAVNAFTLALLTAAPLSAASPCVVWQRPRLAKVGPPPVTARLGVSFIAITGPAALKWYTLRSRLN